ncbi:MAG: hemolysin family protein [Spirochaetaceae bacterium]|jgi:CBS domain containing-hemolysin-like protein|nr:hemolysin family protein [Spirochaetaceae bacterium]
MLSLTTSILIALAGLLAFSAFFSASETAFSSVNRIKLKNLAAQGKKAAVRALKLLDNYDTLITTILIGNNVVNIISSGLATLLFVRLVGDNAGVSLATLVMTVLVLLFGEITPKTLAREDPETFAMRCAPVLKIFTTLFTPINSLASHWKRVITRLLRIEADRSITEAELLTFVEEARQEGGINEREEVMIKRTIDFDEITAREICTPRVDLVAVSNTSSVEEINDKFHQTRFSRLPVYEDSIDNITGLILFKDFYYEVMGTGRPPKEVQKPVVYIPQSMKAPRVLRILQEQKSHLAVIIDEFGGTMGIVTVEDIIEELVGEIWDEHDEIIENIHLIDGGRMRVLGRTPLDELCTACGLENFGDDKATLSQWVLEHSTSGEIHAGDIFSMHGLPLTISKIRHNTVLEVIIQPEAWKQ